MKIDNIKMKSMLKKSFVIFLIVFDSFSALSTPQIPDNIIYKGEKYKLFHSYPMESFLKKYPDKHPKKDWSSNTGLTRGYVATFEIKGEQLYLKDIGIEDGEIINEKGRVIGPKFKSVMNEVFPNQKLVKINWVSGLFVLPVGKANHNVPYGAYSIYERYIVLEIENGILKREKEFTYEEYEEFKKQQFEAFKESEEYEKEKKKLIRKKFTDERIDSMIQFNIIEYSTKILVE